MLELLEGLPGSGKSYFLASERVVPWIKAGRRVYVFLEGVYVDRLAALLGVPEKELAAQVTNWYPDAGQVLRELPHVEPNSAVVLDEIQGLARAKEKLPAEVALFLEKHRHTGVDITATCQNWKQVTSTVTRLVEVTYKFHRMDRFGLGKRYYCKVRGNCEEEEVIRTFVGKYDPKWYGFYSSYAGSGVRETVRRESIMKSGMMIAAVAGAVIAGYVMFGGETGRRGMTVQAAVGKAVTERAPVPAMGVVEAVQAEPLASVPVAVEIRIVGGIGTEGGEWRYVLASGEALTAAQISGRYGVRVREFEGGGVKRLMGPGVSYGQ